MILAYVRFQDVLVPMRPQLHRQGAYRTSYAIHLPYDRLAALSVDLKWKTVH